MADNSLDYVQLRGLQKKIMINGKQVALRTVIDRARKRAPQGEITEAEFFRFAATMYARELLEE